MVPNRVLQKSTALPENSIRSSLVQDVVRRLKNTSTTLPKTHVVEILSNFSQKLVNSGHSVRSSQIVLVHGVTKFAELLRQSKLPKCDPGYKPLHLGRDHDKYNRKLRKILSRTSWYDEIDVLNNDFNGVN